jgi:hypothetical protein
MPSLPSANPADGVRQHALGDIRVYLGPRHEGPRGAAQIVQHPRRDANSAGIFATPLRGPAQRWQHLGVELLLEAPEIADRAESCSGE